MNLVNNLRRESLNEGKNYGMGFSICKQIDENTIKTIIPISSCKDYLNDVVFNETTNKPIKAYGCSLKEKSNLYDNNYFYMVVEILPYICGNIYKNQIEDTELLLNNRDSLLSFMNQIETLLLVDLSEFIVCENNDNVVIIKVPIYWLKATYLISLYSLLLRIGLYYDNSDVLSYLKNFNKTSDAYLINTAYSKLIKLIKRNLIPDVQDFSKLSMDTSIHNYGINNCIEITI
jgi:hypothetical protein